VTLCYCRTGTVCGSRCNVIVLYVGRDRLRFSNCSPSVAELSYRVEAKFVLMVTKTNTRFAGLQAQVGI